MFGKRKDNNLFRKNSRSQKIVKQRQLTLIEENKQRPSFSQYIEVKPRRMQETRSIETQKETDTRRNAYQLRRDKPA